MHRLLVDLFVFMEPYLRHSQLVPAIRTLYKGTLRVLLVLLHDFPEFLCDYHFSFCDVIPHTCIQLRNLFLSAFPRAMCLPDPFTPNLKVDLLPEISQPPRILSNIVDSLAQNGLRQELDFYLQNKQPKTFLDSLPERLRLSQADAAAKGTAFNVPAINSLIVYVGAQGIAHQSKNMTNSPVMDIFQNLIRNFDAEGRYFLLNAIANQLRYPNNHTHCKFPSCRDVKLISLRYCSHAKKLCWQQTFPWYCCSSLASRQTTSSRNRSRGYYWSD